ncbi:MAG: galactitol-1-phosphate 5-dehydrogenase [Spirochaetaceae bacterium]|jgi:L-iditol 2-dehydrogenase|nr:galactitol-1-phosphate 5-dehydrogenase [Spirochaetaceae bacterium]
MISALRDGLKKVKSIEKEIPEISENEVLIKVAFAGICGSDIHRVNEDLEKWDRIVLGHEFSGIIEKIGSHVEGYKLGQKVSAAPLVPCHKCNACKEGNFSLCKGYTFIGSRKDGAFAEYVVFPSENLVPLSDDFPLIKGALIEPVTVCLHPILRLGNLLGKTVAVIGLGGIGLLAVQIFKSMGVKNIIVTDVIEEKIALAIKLGATHGVNVLKDDLKAVAEALGGAEIVFEASGTLSGKKSAIEIARGRGRILLVGTNPSQEVVMDGLLFELISRKELEIIGSWMNYSNPWPGKEWSIAAWMLESGMIQTDEIITHIFPLKEVESAFNVIYDQKEPFIKVVLQP